MENTQKTDLHVDEKTQKELQEQLLNYQNDPSAFTSYLDTMKKIDKWLESGAEK